MTPQTYIQTMDYLCATILLCFLYASASSTVNCQQQQQQQQAQDFIQPSNVPYYIQSPIANRLPKVLEKEQIPLAANSQEFDDVTQQRSKILRLQKGLSSGARMLDMALPKQVVPSSNLSIATNATPISDTIGVTASQKQQQQQQKVGCLYDKRHFSKLDECMARKPYPTIGLPAFKNEDLLIKRGLSEKFGCSFILNNGLFKNYQISKYSIESDSQCLDNDGKVELSLNFSNVSLSYLWTLRCLNRADQLLDDATLNGRTSDQITNIETTSTSSSTTTTTSANHQPIVNDESLKSTGSICIGSSQNFGFASLQLSNIEARIELSTDIYKNWRITNVTVAMVTPNGSINPQLSLNKSETDKLNDNVNPNLGYTNIRDYTFESLDGDELNWRYLHLFQNWSRNRIHSNFLEQYRRFLWISLQRCLNESAEKLPVKLHDVFTNHLRYN